MLLGHQSCHLVIENNIQLEFQVNILQEILLKKIFLQLDFLRGLFTPSDFKPILSGPNALSLKEYLLPFL